MGDDTEEEIPDLPDVPEKKTDWHVQRMQTGRTLEHK